MMSKVILQPVSSNEIVEHYKDTIENSKVKIWDVKPGKNDINKGRWE